MAEKLKGGGSASEMESPFNAKKPGAPGQTKSGTLPKLEPKDPTGVVPGKG